MAGKQKREGQHLRRAFVGVSFPSMGLSRNENRLFVPASNTKLYTSWLACEVMGEGARFHSEYAVEHGRLYFRALGNPLLSEDSLSPMIEDCRERRIQEVVMDLGFIKSGHYPLSWNIGDVPEAWGAPVSDVCFHENRVTASFSSGSAQPDDCVPSVPDGTFTVGKSSSERVVSSSGVRLPEGYSGTFTYPILSPEMFLMQWISAKIGNGSGKPRLRRGRVKGNSISVAEVTLRETLLRMNKESSNVISELILIHSAARSGRTPSTTAGTELLAERLLKSGIRDGRFVDGSGLSRNNLTSPRSTVTLLEFCRKYRHLIASLPVGGRDGTLKKRRLDNRVVAKTGSLDGVQALSGFAGGEPFSIMINHFGLKEAAEEEVRNWIDQTVMSSL